MSLRVVHHGNKTRGWASAGGCRYDDEDCDALYGPDADAAYNQAALERESELPRDDDGEGIPIATEAERDAGLMPALPASWAVRGGPRDTIYFDPATVRAAIVTVGGLCPGLNDVIRALVQGLYAYGVPDGNVLGIRYGFHGLLSLLGDEQCCEDASEKDAPVVLTLESVDSIHLAGGTVLGTSRGHSDVKRIADAIALLRLDMLYVIGGNGGNAAVDAINNECMDRGMAVAVVGLPKSIDNDILLIDSCFGFNTAVGEAVRAILAANVEARSMRFGVGLVKLMGRSSGFIAAQASIASGEVDVCLLPEVAFDVERVMSYIYGRLRRRGFCTVVIAEGAAQDKMRAELAAAGNTLPDNTDASGNPVLLDAGKWLQAKIKAAAATHGAPLAPGVAEHGHLFGDNNGKNGKLVFAGRVCPDIKYISPAYMIRSVPANTVDKVRVVPSMRPFARADSASVQVFCRMLSHSAVHGAFAAYSGFTAGLCSQHYVILPAHEVVRSTRRLDPRGRSYRMMRAAIAQPEFA